MKEMIVNGINYGSLDFNKTLIDKARQSLCQGAVCCFEQILEAAPHKTATLRSLSSHIAKHSSRTNDSYLTLLEK